MMSTFKQTLRTLTAWSLLTTAGGFVPAYAAQQPGTLASAALTPQFGLASYNAAGMSALPHIAQDQSGTPTATGAAPAPASGRHISKWVWIAIAAGAGIGIGAGVIAGNSQSNHTTAIAPSTTIGVAGGITAGAPH